MQMNATTVNARDACRQHDIPEKGTGTVAVTKVLPCSQQRCQCVLGKCAARVKPFSMTRSTSASTLNGPIISWVLGTHVGTRKHNIY